MERLIKLENVQIYAIIVTEEHDDHSVNPGNQLLIRTKDKKEQEVIMREVALAVAGDVVNLSNGMIMILTAIR